jgi:hypothetical protein
MTNEELQRAIDAAWRNHGRSIWPPTRRFFREHLEALIAIQFQRAGADLLRGSPLEGSTTAKNFGAPTVDEHVTQAQRPFCIHGRRMPVPHLNDPGEPCDLCEDEGNGVPLESADMLPPFHIEHSPACNTRRPETVGLVVAQPCNCNFPSRLAAALGFKSADAMNAETLKMDESAKAVILQRASDQVAASLDALAGVAPWDRPRD